MAMKRTTDTDDVQLDALLRDVVSAAESKTDAAFSDERLAVQRAHILERIAHIGEPGRVIAFPHASVNEPRVFRNRLSSRWVAAAAAAGLTIGLLVGRWSTPRPAGVHPGPTVSARLEPAGPVLLPAAIRLSDDEFLQQIEYAVNGPTEILRPLHELTPLADQFVVER